MSDVEDEKIKALTRLRNDMDSVKTATELKNRLRLLTPVVKESVAEVCQKVDCDAFNKEQINVLSEIVMHIYVTVEPSLRDDPSILRKFMKQSLLNKSAIGAAIITMLVGVFSMADMVIKWTNIDKPVAAQTEESAGDPNKVVEDP